MLDWLATSENIKKCKWNVNRSFLNNKFSYSLSKCGEKKTLWNEILVLSLWNGIKSFPGGLLAALIPDTSLNKNKVHLGSLLKG